MTKKWRKSHSNLTRDDQDNKIAERHFRGMAYEKRLAHELARYYKYWHFEENCLTWFQGYLERGGDLFRLWEALQNERKKGGQKQRHCMKAQILLQNLLSIERKDFVSHLRQKHLRLIG
jgi:hypothetical protein